MKQAKQNVQRIQKNDLSEAVNISYHKMTDNKCDTTSIADAWEIARSFSSLQTIPENSLDKLTESKESKESKEEQTKTLSNREFTFIC